MPAAGTPGVGLVLRLGTAQTLAWGSTYYLPAVLAASMARDLGMAVSTVFLFFSAALLVSAALGPYAGRLIDRSGGRGVLAGTSLVFALGLALLGLAQGPRSLLAGWIVIGVGMGSGLYEAAFSALVVRYGDRARGAITGITLLAGFASTVGWPLSAFVEAHLGWRAACFVWAALHLTLGLGLNLSLPRVGARPPAPHSGAQSAPARTPAQRNARLSAAARWTGIALSFVFAASWFISTAMAAHLLTLLQVGGASLASAVLVGTLIGPAQVAARLLEFSLLRHMHPLISARVAAALHPLGALLLGVFGAPAAVAFGVLHGAGNGILTIAKGTLPLVIFGPGGYGERQGLLMVPARVVQAFAPWLFGVCLDAWGLGALWLSSAIGLAALLVLGLMPRAVSVASYTESGHLAGGPPHDDQEDRR